MNKSKISAISKGVRAGLSKHSPEILTGIGIAGMITTVVLAVKATPKAINLIEEKKKDIYREQKGHDPEYRLDYQKPLPSKLDYIKVVWKQYIPAAITGAASISCIIGASSVHAKRNAALATAYKLTETALSEYKEKVVEEIGEKKEKVIREKIAQDHIKKNPVSDNQVIITEKGNTLCYDDVSGRYFKSDIDAIKSAINEVNRKMTYENYISLTEFYTEIGLAPTSMSDYLGWNLDDGLLEIDLGAKLTDDGQPCIVLQYLVAPRYEFDKLM